VALNQLLFRCVDRLVQNIDARLPAEERNIGVAEDIAQEAMITAARDIRTFKPQDGSDGGFFPWLAKIAEHRMFDVLKARRAKKRRPRNGPLQHAWRTDGELVELLAVVAINERTPSRSAARHEAAELVRAALNSLDEDYRVGLRLRFLEGLSPPEIARRMGRTEGAVQMLCRRALDRLREAMGDSARFFSRKE
jgi:RNA polymerase sigma-70 factor (subfamily 1)